MRRILARNLKRLRRHYTLDTPAKAAAAELAGHAAISRAHAERGCKYAGSLPVRPGPGGKAMKLQWFF